MDPRAVLPTTLETADILSGQIFRQFGLPEDIISDRGPQFTSPVWKELLGYQLPLYPCNALTSDQPVVERQCRQSKWTWEETHQRLSKAIATYKSQSYAT
ncbi:hypothetical protein P4O66_001125 [Electrophorus voltai]|uniref:Integrase catalytic domain-containing protein n=1 Tax=Electrophorus voltai TaxID=2609070 RepID=A0AAD9DVM3_9TELE|nr:hypothetical protein P4O66_001125 [Electrophorus voltai]